MHSLDIQFNPDFSNTGYYYSKVSIEDKFKALQEIESEQLKSLVAQKFVDPRNTIFT